MSFSGWGSSSNNNNSSNNTTSSWGFGNSNSGNNSNSNSNSGGNSGGSSSGWGTWGSTTNNNNSSANSNSNNNNNAGNNQSQFITRKSLFSSLDENKKKEFLSFDEQIVRATESKKNELDATIKKLEQLPDIAHSLRIQSDQTRLLTEKLDSYKHDLEPFTAKLKSEFVCASRAQVDVQRQSMQSVQVQDLPPKFYWDKMEQFEVQMNDLRKQLASLHQHLSDSINNPQPTEVINTKSVANALNASRRTTLNIAAQVISNHQQIEKMKGEYKEYRLRHFGDSHDPFFDAKEKEKQRQQKIEQYVHEQNGLQMNGFQLMGNANNGSNGNNAGNHNQSGNSGGGGGSAFGFGGGSSGNTKSNGNTNSSGWGAGTGSTTTGWGSNSTNNSNNSNNSNSNSSSGGGFNWGSSTNSNSNSGGASTTTFNWGI